MTSYLHRPGKVSFMYQTIPQRVNQLAQNDPDKPAIVVYKNKEDRQQITRKQIYDGAVKFAKALINLGIQKGELVAYSVSNCVEWLIYEIGIIMTGAISVKVMLGLADFKTVLYGCSLVVFDSKYIWENFLKIADISDNGKVSSEIYPNLRLAIAVSEAERPENALFAAKLMEDVSSKTDVILPSISPDDTALISQSSGSTGAPKRICHSHFNWINGFYTFYTDAGVNEKDKAYCSRPMGYVVGYPSMFLSIGCTHVTGDVTMLNNNENIDFIMNLWKTEKCDVIWVVPQRLKYIKESSFRVKRIISGGDLIARDWIENSFRLADKFSLGYGSTETVISAQRLFSKENMDQHVKGMLGRPLPGSEVKILDQNKNVVPIGSIGSLYIRSCWTQKIFQDGTHCLEEGWIPTSDICKLTPEGDLIMIGRSVDFIKKSTVKLSIKTIEEYVGRHPSVAEVIVVPIPDESFGECICACVTILPGHKFNREDLTKFCTETMPHPSNFDHVTIIPDYFLHFTSFPKLPSEKFNKQSIKRSAIEMVKESYGK
ncbi:putative acyl-CoA synthetase YngI [Octopus bimaculoides]|uniref:AMP-dependent synthetase/ligase domain-containing protein n=1 Tax=Octopus bimaculoides TaxID=37653 RepID=A0A0L8GLM8_OCTBM|nr:putative acyl-CoA synthetase YngI [Octopus bimaculoides]XP_014779993.1 putative acyl-CoA synthetase YngI [Octopus bimaculoides]XP_052826002.1 putative acyl-CoA synthetase YngI [Octopus bimaculoides]XP_052826003.1 putative acyl-CoA synthetase YngI [Octopus bimaculoides]|eukprot:XP_014779992.1 PREDICTED: putative acyl-CoA synthetase YngI [Octopus bimaculoides]